MYNLLRNIGCSVGIAVSATLVACFNQHYESALVAHIQRTNPLFQQKLAALSQAVVARGVPQSEAEHTALTLIYNMVRRHAGILAFNHTSWILGIAFLLVIPCLLLLRTSRVEPAAGPH